MLRKEEGRGEGRWRRGKGKEEKEGTIPTGPPPTIPTVFEVSMSIAKSDSIYIRTEMKRREVLKGGGEGTRK